jgi:broad specificity polyphosphatase/5'/3'-nucleotidase SurE
MGSSSVGSTTVGLAGSGVLVGGGSVAISAAEEQADKISIDNASRMINVLVLEVFFVVMINSCDQITNPV